MPPDYNVLHRPTFRCSQIGVRAIFITASPLPRFSGRFVRQILDINLFYNNIL